MRPNSSLRRTLLATPRAPEQQEKVSRLLVATDLAEGDGARAVVMGYLDAAGGGRRLAGGLGGESLAGRLAAVDLHAGGFLSAGGLGGECLAGRLAAVDLRAVCLV